MHKFFAVVAGVLVTLAGVAFAADDFPKVETTPEFEYIHTSPPFGTQVVNGVRIGNQSFNCLGGGGGFAYNFTSLVGIVGDLDWCKFTIEPFGEILFGGDRLSLTCKAGSTICQTFFPNTSRNAFALGAGGGINVKLTRRLILRPVDAEYLYTRFGNNCAPGVNLNVCHSNQSQNSFRLTSGLTIGWGGSARY